MLTVMAGAAVSPALANISAHFAGVDPYLIKLILTLPGLCIMLSNMVFPLFLKRFDVKTIVLIGLGFYTIGGTAGAFTDNIYLLLVTRALIGIGVGLIMPMSTGLLAYYFESKEQKKLMGYSVAANNLGGILAMSLSGYLASIRWYYSFYVYLLGIVATIFVLIYLPKDRIEKQGSKLDKGILKEKALQIFAMFLTMMAFFAYITNFSMQSVSENIIQGGQVGIWMSFNSIGAMICALNFGKLAKKLGNKVEYLGLGSFLLAFVLLTVCSSKIAYIIASFAIGSGMGITMPCINSNAVKNIDKRKATTIMSVMSMSMYLGQFVSPALSSVIMKAVGSESLRIPYIMAGSAIILVMVITHIDCKSKTMVK